MSLQITKITNHAANVDSEYVQIAVIANTNLSMFELVDNSYNADGTISNIHNHSYKFPNQQVNKGDSVTLHTGEGVNRVMKSIIAGYNNYHYYWVSDQSFWNDTGDTARIFKRQLVSELVAPAKPKPFTK